MALFRPTPNLDDNERARLEFRMQRIADSIGVARMKLPVVAVQEVFDSIDTSRDDATNGRAVMDFVSNHLDHELASVAMEVSIEQAAKCSSGG